MEVISFELHIEYRYNRLTIYIDIRCISINDIRVYIDIFV